MDSDINNPLAVKALLDQLRASRAWQDTLNSTSSCINSEQWREPPSSVSEDVQDKPDIQSLNAPPSTSVASLLSQLRPSERTPVAANTPPVSEPNPRTLHQSSRNVARPSQELPSTQQVQSVPAPSPTHVQDIRSMSFQQALPHLTQLASDPGFLAAVSRLRQEQNQLEQQLWEERQAIHRKHEEKVKVARTKATLIGAGLSKHEADMMNDAYRRDVQKFDTERVLVAWGVLIEKQQGALESLGVPTMFATTSQADCQKQRRVIQVLEGL